LQVLVKSGTFFGKFDIRDSRGGPLGIGLCGVGRRGWGKAGRLIFPQSVAWARGWTTGVRLRWDRSMVSATSGWLILILGGLLWSPTALSGKSPENLS
jgi:hypothetical protein